MSSIHNIQHHSIETHADSERHAIYSRPRMRKVLLTQSQVSIAITITIVTAFTFLLFLAGYILQQQTIRELQSTIRPRIPTRPDSAGTQTPLAEQITPSRLFGGSEGSKGRLAFQKYIQAGNDVSEVVDWKRLAHIQLVSSHHDVCSAIIIFADLAARKSPARRILLFPQDWAIESAAGQGEIGDPYLVTSIRLLRLAARRYAVELRPITPTIKRGPEQEQDVYSLASAFAFSDVDRAMRLEGPGTVLDASRFDAMLAFTDDAPLAVLGDTSNDASVHSHDIYMLQPSAEKHQELKEYITRTSAYNDTMLAAAFAEPLKLTPSDDDTNMLIRSVGQLHDVGESFNSSEFMLTAAYIRFSDPKLPGPEWEVPFEQKLEARPSNHDADWLWTELYGQYAQRRADVCGLGLEQWRP